MELRQDTFRFPSNSGNGPVSTSKTFTFLRNVRTATAGLSGYTAKYDRRSDHHLGNLDVRLITSFSGRTVTVTGIFGLRDWSGEWDDAYSGEINYTLIADVA